jgi:hypothetical protein
MQWVEGKGLDYYDTEWRPSAIAGIAQFLSALTTREFNGIGSLHPGPHGPELGPLIWKSVQCGLLGPFKTSQEMYIALIDARLATLAPRPSPTHWGGFPYRRLHAALAYVEMRALVLAAEDMAVEGPTYLRHGDEKGDIFRIDADGKLDWVLDWEFAYTAPLPELMAWGMFKEQDKFDKLLGEELMCIGRNDLADAMTHAHKYVILREAIAHFPSSVSTSTSSRSGARLTRASTTTTRTSMSGLQPRVKSSRTTRSLRRLRRSSSGTRKKRTRSTQSGGRRGTRVRRSSRRRRPRRGRRRSPQRWLLLLPPMEPTLFRPRGWLLLPPTVATSPRPTTWLLLRPAVAATTSPRPVRWLLVPPRMTRLPKSKRGPPTTASCQQNF